MPVLGAPTSSTSLGWKDLKADFAAKGDGRYLTDGAITSGQATFSSTSAAFTSTDVGKVVWIFGAGAAGVVLITTISSVSSGVATLAATAGTTIASGGKFFYGTDDTAAIQNAINAANTQGGGTIYAPRGVYMINGAQQTGSVSGTLGGSWTFNYTGQILFPGRDTNVSGKATIRLLGETPAPQVYWLASFSGSDTAPILTGTVFLSSATTGAAFAGIPGVQGQQGGIPMTDLHVIFDSLSLYLPNLPTAHGINADIIGSISTDNMQVGVMVGHGQALTAPTSGTATGIKLPRSALSAFYDIHRSQVYGFPRGIEHGEHAHLDSVTIEQCNVAIYISSAGHMSVYGKVLVQECSTVIQNVSSSGPIINGLICLEENGAVVYKALIDDTTGTLSGNLTVSTGTSPSIGHPVGGIPGSLNIRWATGASTNTAGLGNNGWMGQYPSDTFKRLVDVAGVIGLADNTAHPWFVSIGTWTTGAQRLVPVAGENFAWPTYNASHGGSRVIAVTVITGGTVANVKAGLMLQYVNPFGIVVVLDGARNLVAIQKRTGTSTYTDLAVGTAGAPAIAGATSYKLLVVLKEPADPTASWTMSAYLNGALAVTYIIDATTQGQITDSTLPFYTYRDGCWTSSDTSSRFDDFSIRPFTA